MFDLGTPLFEKDKPYGVLYGTPGRFIEQLDGVADLLLTSLPKGHVFARETMYMWTYPIKETGFGAIVLPETNIEVPWSILRFFLEYPIPATIGIWHVTRLPLDHLNPEIMEASRRFIIIYGRGKPRIPTPLVFSAPARDRIHYSLAKDLIQALTKPGDVVLDIFAGYGTISNEAIIQNRRTIAIESDRVAYESTLSRLEKIHKEVVYAESGSSHGSKKTIPHFYRRSARE